eukprot:1026950-Prymnesium_polylepis.1
MTVANGMGSLHARTAGAVSQQQRHRRRWAHGLGCARVGGGGGDPCGTARISCPGVREGPTHCAARRAAAGAVGGRVAGRGGGRARLERELGIPEELELVADADH